MSRSLIVFLLAFSCHSLVSGQVSETLEAPAGRFHESLGLEGDQYKLVLSNKPMNYLVDGHWQRIEQRLEASEEEGIAFNSTGSDCPIRYSELGELSIQHPLIDDQWWLSKQVQFNQQVIYWEQAQLVNDTTISSFSQQLPICRTINTTYGRTKTSYTLFQEPAYQNEALTITERMRLPDYVLIVNQGNTLLFLGQLDDTLAYQKPPIVYDAADDDALRGQSIFRPDYEVINIAPGVYDVSYSIPEAYLSDPQRIYPIEVDPVFTFSWVSVAEMETPGVLTTDLTTIPCLQHDTYQMVGSFYDAYAGAWRSDVSNIQVVSCGATSFIPSCFFNSGGICNLPTRNLSLDCVSDDICTPEIITAVFSWDNFFGFGFIDGVFNLELTFTTPTFNAGGITPAQSITSGSTPAALTSTAPATVSTPCATITYQWQQMDGACDCGAATGSWTNIPGATGPTLPSGSMGPLTADRCYRRLMNSECNAANDWDDISAPANRSSNCLQMSVTPLAVQFAKIQAVETDAGVLVEWETVEEVNVRHYAVQRIDDSGVWQTLGFLRSNTGSTQQEQYSFLDVQVEPGAHYQYRVTERDYDGNITHSQVATVTLSDAVVEHFTVSPNPASDEIRLNRIEPGVQLKMFGLNGQLVLDQTLSSSKTIDVSELSSGVYQIQAIDARGHISVSRFVKP